MTLNRNAKIYIAGHTGMVGSALLVSLLKHGYKNVIVRERKNLNLLNQNDVKNFFSSSKPEYVFICAAKVGGINANNEQRADFLFENLQIQNNLIFYSKMNKVKKLLFLGSSCIYPKHSSQPIKEEYLLDGKLEKTNEPYAIAKIAGVKLCENYFRQYSSNFYSVMPTNLYGMNDNYDLKSSHVIPALIKKIHIAKINNNDTINVWGTGRPLREFMHVDDLVEACIFLMKNVNAVDIYKQGISHINIGSGEEISIKDLVALISQVVCHDVKINFQSDMPDGTPRKLLDCNRLKEFGWSYNIRLKDGLKKVYKAYKSELIS